MFGKKNDAFHSICIKKQCITIVLHLNFIYYMTENEIIPMTAKKKKVSEMFRLSQTFNLTINCLFFFLKFR